MPMELFVAGLADWPMPCRSFSSFKILASGSDRIVFYLKTVGT